MGSRVRGALRGLAMAMLVLAVPKCARGQGSLATLADDIIAIASGQRSNERAREASQLGPIHGSGKTGFLSVAGTDAPRLGGPVPQHRPLDTLQAASRAIDIGAPRDRDSPLRLPTRAPAPRLEPPLYGPIKPADEDEGPPHGMTIEQALALMVRANPDLGVKFQEIPKAEADILTASLWGNPLIFAAADSVPYGGYSPQRPGSTNYGITLVQPFDVNGKIRARTRLAQANRQVLCALYQDAVRLEAENVHSAFVDVLAARTTVRYLRTSLANFDTLLTALQQLYQKSETFHSEIDSALIQREITANSLDEALTRLRQSKRSLALLLGIPAAHSDAIELRGRVGDEPASVPPTEELVGLALANRPDLAAVRLGVQSAQANTRVQRRERFPDVFALYTPYSFNPNNDGSANTNATTSWAAGIFATIPIADRNQGNIRRAKWNLLQTQMEASAREHQVAAEVENAAMEHASAHAAAERFERTILPRAAHRFHDFQARFTEGHESLDTFLNAQRDYNDVVRLYRNALVRRRRAILTINTTVGLRLLP